MKVNPSIFLAQYASPEYRYGIYIPEAVFHDLIVAETIRDIMEIPDDTIDRIILSKSSDEKQRYNQARFFLLPINENMQ